MKEPDENAGKPELERIDSTTGAVSDETLEDVSGGTIYLTDPYHSDTTADDAE